jgi:hypothetical protein
MAVPDRAPLDAYLRRQVVLDRALRKVLRATIKGLNAEINRLAATTGPGNAVRLAQLSLNREIMNGWLAIGDVIETNVVASADDLAKVQRLFDQDLMRKMGVKMTDQFKRSLLATAQQGLESYISRSHHNFTLSERVYRNGRRGVRTVENLIDQGLLSGKSAREIALSVRKYINPNVPGGMSYAAMRLARTELNNAFHQTSIRMAAEDPFTTALRWNLSGSHPRPDICNEYAEKTHFRNGSAGEFRVGDVPSKPHPQCLCYTTPVVIGEEDFLRNLRQGKYDDMAA